MRDRRLTCVYIHTRFRVCRLSETQNKDAFLGPFLHVLAYPHAGLEWRAAPHRRQISGNAVQIVSRHPVQIFQITTRCRRNGTLEIRKKAGSLLT